MARRTRNRTRSLTVIHNDLTRRIRFARDHPSAALRVHANLRTARKTRRPTPASVHRPSRYLDPGWIPPHRVNWG
jgi:hypothetical protein